MSSKIIMPDGSSRHMGRKRSVAPSPRLALKSYLKDSVGVAIRGYKLLSDYAGVGGSVTLAAKP